MPDFTPSPWEFGEDMRGRKRVFSGTNEIVRAMSKHGSRVLSQAERAANAHLIAAAPDLYEALDDILAHGVKDDGTSETTAVLGAARAALAKARGETP